MVRVGKKIIIRGRIKKISVDSVQRGQNWVWCNLWVCEGKDRGKKRVDIRGTRGVRKEGNI